MDKLNRDIWTSLDSHIIRKERVAQGVDETPSPDESTLDLSQIDFEQGEKIELLGDPEISQNSHLQYFSNRIEFKNRLNALMTWNNKVNLRIIYGILTIKQAKIERNNTPLAQQQDVTAKFENFFVKNIRVPRKYYPPTLIEQGRRKSDDPDYCHIRGNFDLVCRTPAEGENPHILEFVLYDCGYKDALKKIKILEKYALDLQLTIEAQISYYTG